MVRVVQNVQGITSFEADRLVLAPEDIVDAISESGVIAESGVRPLRSRLEVSVCI
jgi:hypothetical protein